MIILSTIKIGPKDNLSKKFNLKIFDKLIQVLMPKKISSWRYKTKKKILGKSETGMNMKGLYKWKIISIIVFIPIILAVNFTNISYLKDAVISKTFSFISFDYDMAKKTMKDNLELYKKTIKHIGKREMARLSDEERAIAVKNTLERIGINQKNEINEKTEFILAAYERERNVKLFNWKLVVSILLIYYIPEILLILNGLMRRSRYKKEIIKLEGIFELLGGAGMKTVEIIKEMSVASKLYKKYLKTFSENFSLDKEKAIEDIKHRIKDNSFGKLVDTIRIYAVSDHKTALEILERNRIEREQETLLLAAEDVDTADIIALLAITPLLWEMANLMLRPIIDIVNEMFSMF